MISDDTRILGTSWARGKIRIAIVGSRNYPHTGKIRAEIDKLDPRTHLIISGGARGVDQAAERYAAACGFNVITIRPNYYKFAGKVAPLVRNREIVDTAHRILAFWDGQSNGTRQLLAYARKTQKHYTVIS